MRTRLRSCGATAAALSGDFSGLESADCQASKKPGSIVDPKNGNQPFPNVQVPRTVKISKGTEGSRSSMMDIEDEHNHMGAALSLRDRIGQPRTSVAE